MPAQDTKPIRLAELMATLSLATDLGMGQPMEQALRTCLLATFAARETGLRESDLSDVYYLALLRFVGCTADAASSARAVGGDEIAYRAALAPVLMGDTPRFVAHMLRRYASDRRPPARIRAVALAVLDAARDPKASIAEHCEVAQVLITRLGLRRQIGVYVGNLFERWDGKGIPGEVRGEDIPLPARIVALARDTDVLVSMGGWDLAADALRRRRGRAYDPALADLLLANGRTWTGEAAGDSTWRAVLEAEPRPRQTVDEANLDAVLQAFADFVDLKSPRTLGHSAAVAELASKAAVEMGLPAADARRLGHAGLVHDLGKAGVPGGILEKRSALSPEEWERVRLHPYLTERILSYSPALSGIAALAGMHHEHMDGSGFHRGLSGAALAPEARLLAAACAFVECRERAPGGASPASTKSDMQRAVDAGRLDGDAVRCVFAAAGLPVAPGRSSRPAGLTEREVEILGLISRGYSNKQVARQLTISVKTVGSHVEHIYTKIGVSSRAAAALFAIEHRLLEP